MDVIYTIYCDTVNGLTNPMRPEKEQIKDIQRAYANKVGAAYVCNEYTDPIDFNELQVLKLKLLQTYTWADKIVYMDFDVLPKKGAADILKRNDKFAMLPLYRESTDKKLQLKRKALAAHGDDIILNTGVISTTSKFVSQLGLSEKLEEFRSLIGDSEINNEAFVTWMCEKYDIDYDVLPLSFNMIHDKDDQIPHHLAHFIHYSSKQFDFSLH